MAAVDPFQSLQEEATCSICLEYYTDPVTTECGHNFCRSCITECWQGSDTDCPCPQCRLISPQQSLRPNRQLLNMVELVRQIALQAAIPQEHNLCDKHQEKLKIFCKEDQKAICVVCSISADHRFHAQIPIDEASMEYKGKVQDWLPPLRKEMEGIMRSKLKEEEESKAMRDVSSTLIRCEHFKFKEPEKGMKNYKGKEKNDDYVRNPRTIDEMKNYKVLVSLDPDTASSWLILSEEGRRARRGDTAQTLPHNTKRFTFYSCVLGSEGFSSGRHYWEVQLLQEGLLGWSVGAARESVSRKGGLTGSPEQGVWAVKWFNGQYQALTSPETPLSLLEKPRKLGVYLDYEGGWLSLYNADTMEHLYTFTNTTFTERIFPFFWIGEGAELHLV